MEAPVPAPGRGEGGGEWKEGFGAQQRIKPQLCQAQRVAWGTFLKACS